MEFAHMSADNTDNTDYTPNAVNTVNTANTANPANPANTANAANTVNTDNSASTVSTVSSVSSVSTVSTVSTQASQSHQAHQAHQSDQAQPEGSTATASKPIHFGSHPCVVLVGPPGAGKSTIGRRLASALNCELVDSDLLIEEGENTPCGELFTALGEEEFRKVEERYVAKALETHGVVSLGGGAVLSEATRGLLESMTVVLIDVSAEEAVRRTAGDPNRPVLRADDPLEHYRQLLEARQPFYRAVADLRVRTNGRTPQQVVGDILSFLES